MLLRQGCGQHCEHVVRTHRCPFRFLPETSLFRGFLIEHANRQSSQSGKIIAPLRPLQILMGEGWPRSPAFRVVALLSSYSI